MTLTLLLSLLLSGALQKAILVEDTEYFRLNSATSGELSVSKTIVVTEEKGIGAAIFYLYCDTYRSLKSFSGTVQSGTAKPRKIKKDELLETSLSEGLVDDGKRYYYEPQGHFPLTVHYEYKISFSHGIPSFPVFIPIDSTDESIEQASYTVDVPEGYPIKMLHNKVEYNKTTQKGRDLHQWTASNVAPIIEESMMPSVMELCPYVYCSPQELNMSGYKGMQRDWKDIGQWLWNLQEGTGELSSAEVARVQEMTADCQSDFQKLSVLYAYLREKTRYVSIQLGIGGLKPIPAKEVSRMGFGDCKGLSKYMQSLLAAVGVPSDYLVIDTDSANLLPGYASMNQMNHVMVAVPLPEYSDTVWVECTNPTLPLGYRHANAAGHRVVLVKEDGGELVRIPSYADSISARRRYTDISLDQDGIATIKARLELSLDETESYLDFKNLREDRKKAILSNGLHGNAWDIAVIGINDNFQDYQTQGRYFVPQMDISYKLLSSNYASTNGDRLFIPVNPYPKSFIIQKGKRHNEICRTYNLTDEDIITLHIPGGYTVENLPANEEIDTEWGQFSTQTELSSDGKTIQIRQTLKRHPFRAPASSYPSYAAYNRKLNRQYSANIVLKKN